MLDEGKEYECEAIIKKFNDDIAKLNIGGGLEYRVERSRYYVEEFQNTIPGLRLGRVEGYQPYDAFVKQKLGARYAFINRLGVRYERAVNSTFRLTQSQLSLSLTNVQKFGEVIIFSGLLPYYINSLLEAVLDKVGWITTCSVWAACVGVGVFRFMQYFKPGNKISIYAAIFSSMIIGALFGVLLALIHNFLGNAP